MDEEMIDRAANDDAMKRFNDGEPLPSVQPDYLQRMWEFMPAGAENKAVGIGAIAGAADPRLLQRDGTVVAIMLRMMLLKSLVEREVLSEYAGHDTLKAEVFRAAATMPCGKEEVSEALGLNHLRQLPPEQATKMRSEMRAAGYDSQQSTVDAKFLAWLKEIMKKSE